MQPQRHFLRRYNRTSDHHVIQVLDSHPRLRNAARAPKCRDRNASGNSAIIPPPHPCSAAASGGRAGVSQHLVPEPASPPRPTLNEASAAHSPNASAAAGAGPSGLPSREPQSQALTQPPLPPQQQSPEHPEPLLGRQLQPLQQPRKPHAVAVAPIAGPFAAAGHTAATAAAGPTATRRGVGLALAASAAATAVAAATAIVGPASAAAAPSGGSSSNSGGGSSRFLAQATSPAGQQQQPPEGAGGGDAGTVVRPVRRSWPLVPQVPLAPGLRVSKVIRGCWQLSGRHKGDPMTDRTSGGDAVADLAAFHRAGVTTLDVADNYGPAEILVGQYIRLYPGDSSTTTIATKLSYLTEEDMAGVSRTMVEYAVRSSLVRLGRQRLDLVQLQWAEPVRHRRWLDVLKWLSDLREEGLIGHLGVCNFAVPQLAAAVSAGVPLVSNQVQFSLIDRRPQLFMQKAAASYGIKLLAYGTVAGGLLADRYYDAPAGKVRLDTASKQKYGLVVRQSGEMPGGAGGAGWAWMQEVLQATRTVAQRYGVSSSAVATAWVLHQPQVAAAIVGARNILHMRDMQAACALVLDDGDLLDLDAVWEGVPNPPTSDVYVWERGGPW